MNMIRSYAAAACAAICSAVVCGAAQGAAYSIASGDVLDVSVYRQDDMKFSLRVDPEGFIRFPIAGRIYVSGKPMQSIESTIARALKKHGYSDPEVVVSVHSYAPRNVYVAGAVESSSGVAIPEGGEITAMQAVATAGGLAEDADINGIVVRRLSGGKIETVSVPAKDILAGKNVADIVLKPGDSVVVPKIKPVSVLGTVKKAGKFYANGDSPLTVSMVIALAGGVERPNSLSEIRVTRGDKSIEVDIRSLLETGKGGNDIVLEPGDVVYVPETRW